MAAVAVAGILIVLNSTSALEVPMLDGVLWSTGVAIVEVMRVVRGKQQHSIRVCGIGADCTCSCYFDFCHCAVCVAAENSVLVEECEAWEGLEDAWHCG